MVRLLGLDPGTKRCGVAVTNRDAIDGLSASGASDVTTDLAPCCAGSSTTRSVERVVVGRPVALSGRETASTEAADGLFARLATDLAPTAGGPVRRTTDDRRGATIAAAGRA